MNTGSAADRNSTPQSVRRRYAGMRESLVEMDNQDGARVSGDPFRDPAIEDDNGEHNFAMDATLAVGRNASLTLGTDALIVLGRSLVSALLVQADRRSR